MTVAKLLIVLDEEKIKELTPKGLVNKPETPIPEPSVIDTNPVDSAKESGIRIEVNLERGKTVENVVKPVKGILDHLL